MTGNFNVFFTVITLLSVSQTFSSEILNRIPRSSDRDPYVFNLFEMILTTLDTKLKHIENLDRSINQLSKKLDVMEEKLAVTVATTTRIEQLIGNKETKIREDSLPKVTRVVRHRPYFTHEHQYTERREFGPSPRIANPTVPRPKPFIRSNNPPTIRSQSLTNPMESKLEEVVKRVVQIDNKLLNLQEQLHNEKTEELIASGSENQKVEKTPDLTPLHESVDNVRHSIVSVDQRLQDHASTIGKNFGEINKEIYSMKSALEQLENERKKWMCSSNSNITDGCVSPLDELRSETEKILQTIIEKKEKEIEETNVIKQEQTKQSKTLQDLKQKVTETTSKILGRLAELRRDLKKEKEQPTDARGRSINPIALLQRAKLTDRKLPINTTPRTTPPAEEGSTEYSVRDEIDESVRHSGVIFPQKPQRPSESTFLSTTETDSGGYTCSELRKKGEDKDGVFHLKIHGTTFWYLQVYCDMTTDDGGWTVIQRRDDFGKPRESFTRDWEDYKHGFGNPSEEFWLGNENIYMITNSDEYALRVMLEDFEGNKRYADYSTFKLHSEEELYKLQIGGYSGNAGDSLNDPWYGSNLSPFSTFDRDNDRSSLNCASMLKGGWWWRSCGRGLNGLYFTNPNDFTARQGIVWFRWRGWDYTLKRTVLMIRPKNHSIPER